MKNFSFLNLQNSMIFGPGSGTTPAYGCSCNMISPCTCTTLCCISRKRNLPSCCSLDGCLYKIIDCCFCGICSKCAGCVSMICGVISCLTCNFCSFLSSCDCLSMSGCTYRVHSYCLDITYHCCVSGKESGQPAVEIAVNNASENAV